METAIVLIGAFIVILVMVVHWIVDPLKEDRDRLKKDLQEMTNQFLAIHEKNISDKISRRDYFAAHAMQSMVAGEGARMVANRDDRYNEANWKEVVAANAYEFADAMQKERNQFRNQSI